MLKLIRKVLDSLSLL
jgi:hypothetical protein